MSDDTKPYTITIGSTASESFTIDASSWNDTGSEYTNNVYATTFTGGIDISPLTDPDNIVCVDTELVNKNPTAKALWEQFNYVYTMIKADKDNEDSDDFF
jgi:hypothetical protein